MWYGDYCAMRNGGLLEYPWVLPYVCTCESYGVANFLLISVNQRNMSIGKNVRVTEFFTAVIAGRGDLDITTLAGFAARHLLFVSNQNTEYSSSVA